MNNSEDPFILVVGCPRSGTTLVRNMLNNHPDVYIFPESQFVNKVWGSRRLIDYRKNQSKIVEVISTKAFDPAIRRAKQKLFSSVRSTRTTFSDYFFEFIDFVKDYNLEGKRYIGDKTPRHALFIKEIASNIPYALKVIVVVRDSRAVVSSLLRKGTIKRLEHGAVIWNFFANHLKTVSRQFHDSQLLFIQYEDIISTPEGSAAKMAEHIGIDYSEQMLYITDSNSSYDKDPKKGIYKDSLNQWQDKLSEQEIGTISFFTQENLSRYGYITTTSNYAPSIISRIFYRLYFFQEAMMYLSMKTGFYPTPSLPKIKKLLKHPLYSKH
jgi:hypothetical protein